MKKKILLLVIALFILIPPVVVLAADVTIYNTCTTYTPHSVDGAGIYWTSTDTGYSFGITTAGTYLWWSKTSDKGASWSTTVTAIYAEYISCWSDLNTPGDHGTIIHIAFTPGTSDAAKYMYFDTYDDTFSGAVTIETFNSYSTPATFDDIEISITKTYGNILAVAYKTDGSGTPAYGFETSVDGGNTWIAKSSPWENYSDHLRIYPANTSDPDDIWGTYWDLSTNEISLQTYDASDNTWSEQLISANMTEQGNLYLQMDAYIRPYDSHLIHSAWNVYNSATADLKVWDINGASNITSLTDVTTNSAGSFQTGVIVDPTNNDIYIMYLKGTIETSVGVYYQKSTDNGITWDGEVSYCSTVDDHRALWFGVVSEFGGRIMPIWYNNDLFDVVTNYENSIEISSNEFSDPAIAPEYVIDCPTCTDNLTSSGNFTSNETFSGGPPGFAVIDAAAEDSGAPPIWLWGWVGMFSIMVPGFFITYMERKHGAGNGNLILRIMIALIIMGLLVTWQRFDWWMIILYLMVAIAPALMSRQYDWGGAGGVSQHGWIGFCATSWIGLTIINRILEGRFLTASESSWWCSIQLFNEFKVFDLFTLPVINFQFFTVGIPSLLRWDYSFFGGNAEIIQYLLYTVTAVVAFILFCIMIGLLFNAFRAR